MNLLVNKNILIICWDFPPNSGIGGRRWAKFAKALIRNGHQIQVIKSENLSSTSNSVWTKDIDFEKIHVTEIKINWAVKWLHDYKSKLKAIKIRVAKLYLSIIERGTVFDKAIGVKTELLNKAEEIINRKKIDVVIVTGAPFNLIYYTAFLKKKFPKLKFIVDYRDPWINSVNYGMMHINESRRNEERRKQDFAFANIDIVTAPNKFLLEEIKASSNSKQFPKLISVEHFYDLDDIVKLKKREIEKEKENISVIYAGALYSDTDKYLSVLAAGVKQFNSNSNAKIKLDLFTDHRSNIFKDHGIDEYVRFSNNIGDKIFERLSDYDYILILLSDHNKNFKTTKYYEFLPYKIPYLYVGPMGEVARSIQEDDIGIVVRSKESVSEIYTSSNKTYGGFNEIESYSLQTRADQLEKLFL